MIVVATPSRGLIHSRTIEAVLRNILPVETLGNPCRWIFSHGDSIPDSFNRLVEQSMAWTDLNCIWFVEEDIVPEPMTLSRMVQRLGKESDLMALAASYHLPGGLLSTVRHGDKLLFSGMGCTAVRAEVFRQIEKPWFRTDRQWTWTGKTFRPVSERPKDYGGHDVDFFVRLSQVGMLWDELKDCRVDHLRVTNLGKPGSNQGCHDIRPL